MAAPRRDWLSAQVLARYVLIPSGDGIGSQRVRRRVNCRCVCTQRLGSNVPTKPGGRAKSCFHPRLPNNVNITMDHKHGLQQFVLHLFGRIWAQQSYGQSPVKCRKHAETKQTTSGIKMWKTFFELLNRKQIMFFASLLTNEKKYVKRTGAFH